MATNNYRNQAKIQESHKTAVNRASWHALSQGIFAFCLTFVPVYVYLGEYVDKSVVAGIFVFCLIVAGLFFAWRDAVLFNRYREMTQEKTPPKRKDPPTPLAEVSDMGRRAVFLAEVPAGGPEEVE